MEGCDFCNADALRDRVIIENELARAFPTHTPIVPYHVLITPTRHAQYLEAFTQEEKRAVEDLRFALHAAFKRSGFEGFNYAWNEEVIGGQSVPHFHLHMLPRKSGDAGVHTYEPRAFLYRSLPLDDRAITPEEELREVARDMRSWL